MSMAFCFSFFRYFFCSSEGLRGYIMMIQLLPYFIKISFKFRGIAGIHRGTHRHGKSNGNDFFVCAQVSG